MLLHESVPVIELDTCSEGDRPLSVTARLQTALVRTILSKTTSQQNRMLKTLDLDR